MINRQGSPRLLLVNNLSQEMENSWTCTCSAIKPGQAQIKSTLFPVSFKDMTYSNISYLENSDIKVGLHMFYRLAQL